MYEKRVENKSHICRADILLMAFLLLIAVGIFMGFFVRRKEGWILTFSCDGNVIEKRALEKMGNEKVRYCLLLYQGENVSCQWYDELPKIPDGVSYNLLSVSGEGVSMEAADCRDQICVRHRAISGGGESIICLPHRLAVEIVGDARKEAPDGMVRR